MAAFARRVMPLMSNRRRRVRSSRPFTDLVIPSRMQLIQLFNLGFSTADAEYPELHAVTGKLYLRFKDWQERAVQVQFHETCAFRWQEAQSLLPGEPYDGACELLESEWVSQHLAQGAVPAGMTLRHLRFNFNACGQLEVLCVSHSVAA